MLLTKLEILEKCEKKIENLRSSVASVKLLLSCDLKGVHHGMTRLPCSPTGMPSGNRAM